MTPIRHAALWLSIISLIHAFGLTPSLQASQRGPVILDPQTYTSPSGVFRLHVDPSQSYGAGAGTYRLTRDGVEVWGGKRPFTLWRAAVSDDGTVAGYAYSQGRDAVRDVGDFRVLILDPKGVTRLEQITKRTRSRFFHTSPNPIASGLIFDPANDRLTIRIANEDLNRKTEDWWNFEVSTGKSTGTFEPGPFKKMFTASSWVVDAQPISGATLTLVHCWHVTKNDPRYDQGALFALVDTKGKVVWELDLPQDYIKSDDEHAWEKIREEVHRDRMILDISQKNKFSVRFFASDQKVTFEVNQQKNGSWMVTEINRKPFVSPASSQRKLQDFPPLTLQALKPISLISPDRKSAHDIRDIEQFAIDGTGRIAFLRSVPGKAAPSFVLITDRGQVVCTIDLESLGIRKEDYARSGLTWVGGHRFLFTSSPIEYEAKARAWWIDVNQKQVVAVPQFDCPAITSVDGFHDGRFVALTTRRSKYTSSERVYLFGADGKRLHEFPGRNDPGAGALFSPMGAAFTSDGKIVVGDGIKNTVTIFNGDGTHVGTVDLTQTWKRRPSYLSRIVRDVDGGYVVVDFQGQPPIIRMKSDRTVFQKLTAKYPDGRTSAELQRCQVAPDGRLWATDGQALVRLTDAGLVDRVLGGKPDPDTLNEVGEVAVNNQAHVFAVDSRSASVHVFDGEGKRLLVHRSNPTDFEIGASLFHLAVMDNQEIYLSSSFAASGRFLHFSADGKRQGFDQLFWWKLKVPSIGPTLYPRAGLGRWVVDMRHVGLLNASGGVERVIDRDPSGKWFQRLHGGAVAPDGTLAILNDDNSGGMHQLKLHIYDPTGKPIRSLDLPFLKSFYAPMAFDGERIAMLNEKKILIFSATGQPVGAVAPDLAGKEKGHIVPFLPAQQKQLWVHDGVGNLLRYALPP